MPPDINFQIDKLQFELKSPLSHTQNERIPIASIKIADLISSVNISQSSSNHTFTKFSKQPTSSAVNGTPGKNSFEERVKSLRGFASLSGALIQFRFVCRQFSVGLHLLPTVDPSSNDKRTMTSGANVHSLGLPSYPVGDMGSSAINTADTALTVKRAHSSDSLHSASSSNASSSHDSNHQSTNSFQDQPGDSVDIQQGRASARTVSTSGDQKQDDLQLKTIPGVNPQVKYIPGETIMESMQHIKDYRFMHGIVERSDDEDEEANEDENGARDGGKHVGSKSIGTKKSNCYTIDTAFDDSASITTKKTSTTTQSAAPTNAVTSITGGIDIKDIISSAPAENAFVFCVILDLDDKGEGAGDIQLQLGGMRLDLSKRVMATLIHPSFADHFLKILKEKSEMDAVLNMHKLPMVIIDWEQNTPAVLLSCDPPLSVLDRLLEQEEFSKKQRSSSHLQQRSTNSKQPQQSTTNNSTRSSIPRRTTINHDEMAVLIDDSHEEYLNMDNEVENLDNCETDNSLSERRSRRAAITFNKNFMQWLAVLEASLPKILSFCVRTSPVIIQSLESTVIRDLVYAKIQSVLDK